LACGNPGLSQSRHSRLGFGLAWPGPGLLAHKVDFDSVGAGGVGSDCCVMGLVSFFRGTINIR
jgi:hypothetical protein